MADIKAILFDYDGVMTLDKTGTESICNYISKIIGIDSAIFESKYREFYPELFDTQISYEDIWDRLCANVGVNIPIKILYDSFINTPIDKEMHNLVKELRNKNYITALVTDNKTDRIRIIKEHFNLNKYFNEIIVSDEVGSAKNTETIFIKTLEKINLEPNECIFIDNHENNLIAPEKLGMITYYFDDKNRNINRLKCELRKYGVINDI